ncbi:type II toxin-antitoxin system VapC family toxin [Acidiferrobacter sp.]|uniref:PIN domain-containing protein n=1 Tax=Acidiferrobacter sp. TaxID=1872107 RepID=UPI00261B1245|nr:type II toxin-antitoxin system VapC family toxin [Acidiferrobacter sp.]
MIGIDTNVLLRWVLHDDEEQAARARKVFESAESILITDIVLVETVWTLRGKRYKATKEDIQALVISLLEEPNMVFESKQVIWSALNDFVANKPVKIAKDTKTADLADALIVNKTKRAARDRRLTYQGTYTFDRAELRIDGTIKA